MLRHILIIPYALIVLMVLVNAGAAVFPGIVIALVVAVLGARQTERHLLARRRAQRRINR